MVEWARLGRRRRMGNSFWHWDSWKVKEAQEVNGGKRRVRGSKKRGCYYKGQHLVLSPCALAQSNRNNLIVDVALSPL